MYRKPTTSQESIRLLSSGLDLEISQYESSLSGFRGNQEYFKLYVELALTDYDLVPFEKRLDIATSQVCCNADIDLFQTVIGYSQIQDRNIFLSYDSYPTIFYYILECYTLFYGKNPTVWVRSEKPKNLNAPKVLRDLLYRSQPTVSDLCSLGKVYILSPLLEAVCLCQTDYLKSTLAWLIPWLQDLQDLGIDLEEYGAAEMKRLRKYKGYNYDVDNLVISQIPYSKVWDSYAWSFERDNFLDCFAISYGPSPYDWNSGSRNRLTYSRENSGHEWRVTTNRLKDRFPGPGLNDGINNYDASNSKNTPRSSAKRQALRL
jgi:hypothetical protein